jgi:hypothetical protein
MVVSLDVDASDAAAFFLLRRTQARSGKAITQVLIGKQSVVFDRIELDEWADAYSMVRGLAFSVQRQCDAPDE